MSRGAILALVFVTGAAGIGGFFYWKSRQEDDTLVPLPTHNGNNAEKESAEKADRITGETRPREAVQDATTALHVTKRVQVINSAFKGL